METISIRLNGKNQNLSDSSLDVFLKSQNIDVSFIAVAVNQEIIPSAQIPKVQLKTGDSVEIVHAVCGG